MSSSNKFSTASCIFFFFFFFLFFEVYQKYLDFLDKSNCTTNVIDLGPPNKLTECDMFNDLGLTTVCHLSSIKRFRWENLLVLKQGYRHSDILWLIQENSKN